MCNSEEFAKWGSPEEIQDLARAVATNRLRQRHLKEYRKLIKKSVKKLTRWARDNS